MVKKLILSLLVLIFLVQVTSAIDTEIIIKTLPDHHVNINFLNPSPDNGVISFDNFNENSGASGNLSFVFSSNELKFDITAFVMKSTETIVYQRFDDNTVGEPLYLILIPGESEIIKNFQEVKNETSEENSTINETTNETLEENGTESKLTSSVIFGEQGLLSNKWFYIPIGIIILLVLGAFVLFKLKKKSKTSKEIKVKKLSELQSEKKEKFQDNKEIIEDAENKIKEAQEDIRKIKNEDKIKEAKKKVIEDEEELVKLREGKE